MRQIAVVLIGLVATAENTWLHGIVHSQSVIRIIVSIHHKLPRFFEKAVTIMG